MATPLTLDEVQSLLRLPRGPGKVVSCYLDASVVGGFKSHGLTHFKTQVSKTKRALADSPEAREEFERNRDALWPVFDTPEARTARSLAVFSALPRGLIRFFALPVPLDDRLVVDDEPYVVPLLQVLCQQRAYLVVLSDTHRGRLYAATGSPAELRLLYEIDEDVPKRQHSSGERWGTQQATIARHREDHILHYQNELIQQIEKTWSDHRFQGIVLLGEHSVAEHLRKRLPSMLAGRVLSEAPCSWPVHDSEVKDQISTLLTALSAQQDGTVAAQLQDRLEHEAAVAVGPKQVIEAIETGKVRPQGHGYLVFGPDQGEAVARCASCNRLFVEMPDSCPRCQAPCLEANLWEELLLHALRHQIVTHFVKGPEILAPYDGLVAVLAGEAARTSGTRVVESGA